MAAHFEDSKILRHFLIGDYECSEQQTDAISPLELYFQFKAEFKRMLPYNTSVTTGTAEPAKFTANFIGYSFSPRLAITSSCDTTSYLFVRSYMEIMEF